MTIGNEVVDERGTLDDRRPRRLEEVVGNEQTKRRLLNERKKGRVPKRMLLHGPTGSGKTTVATILQRQFLCRDPLGSEMMCGKCQGCLETDPASDWRIYSYTASRLESFWVSSWLVDSQHILHREDELVFIDEAQDLSKIHQHELMVQIERARATVILATTHKHELDDALVRRFGVNTFEMARPTPDQIVCSLRELSRRLGVTVNDEQLNIVVQGFSSDLRVCVDFVHTALDQTENGVVTDEFVEAVTGLTRADLVNNETSDDGLPML
ncbi:MAG: AAA family ATPase [Pirellulales bacterium]